MEPAVQEQPLTFPKRPQPSTKFSANPIQLKSNHFTISIVKKNVSICLYDMKIIDFATEDEVPADARPLRAAILISAKGKLKEFFGENYWTSGRDLWSSKDQRDPKTIQTKEKGRDYGIFLTKVTETRLRPEAFEDSETAAKTIQFLNVIFKRYFKEKGYKEWNLNSKFYDWNHRENMDKYPLAICKGFKTSAGVYQNFVPKVLVDRISRIVHTTSVLDYIKHLKSSKKSDQEIREILRGRSVIASYGNYRMWRIDDIDFGGNEESNFDQQNALKGKQKMSYLDYYKASYNIEIKHVQPCLLIHTIRKTGAKIVLLPELVHMTGLDEDMRADFGLMEQVAKSTRLNPNERMNQIKPEVQNLATFLENNYGISMSKESLVDGLVLPTPILTLGNRSFTPQEGSFTVREPIFKPKVIENWLLVYPADYENEADKLFETLKKCSKEFAIQVLDPIKVKIQGKGQSAMKEAIRSKVQANTSIVVCVYPPLAKKPWYKALKDVCYKEKGVPSQAVITTSFEDHPMSVGSKILLQMSAKIGAELWISQRPEGLPEKTMIIGADVYHKTKVGEELLSCIGFCATTNPHFSQFFSKVHFQKRVGDEIMINIGKLVKEAVLHYFKANGKKFFPECIIFFRDGLADNQLQHALEVETQGILQQLKDINPNYNPKFAEIVVTKRIDDRIFTVEETLRSSARGKGIRSNRRDPNEEILFNPPPGTVVADTIVSNNFDYLVMSPYVEQGTCTPTRYYVIYDSTGLSQDVFWQLTYWQCYNYFNWSGSVRVPAPVQYAHKLAYLVGQTVQGDVDKKLVTSLYYL